jgi:hypothetical protein
MAVMAAFQRKGIGAGRIRAVSYRMDSRLNFLSMIWGTSTA